MGRKVDVDELVGAAEIAKRLHKDRKTVLRWRERYEDFPDPVARLEQALVWAWPDIEKWWVGPTSPRPAP